MRFIPKGSVKIVSKNSPAVVFIRELEGRFSAVGYFGKAEKPSFHHYWRDAAKRNAWVVAWFKACDARVAAKDARKAAEQAKRDAGHKLAVGSVLRSSWGYDQTNIDYYQVVALKGKRQVVIREIAAEHVEVASMQGKSVPLKDSFKGEPMVKMVSSQGDSVKIASYANAYLLAPKVVAGLEVGYEASNWSAYA